LRLAGFRRATALAGCAIVAAFCHLRRRTTPVLPATPHTITPPPPPTPTPPPPPACHCTPHPPPTRACAPTSSCTRMSDGRTVGGRQPGCPQDVTWEVGQDRQTPHLRITAWRTWRADNRTVHGHCNFDFARFAADLPLATTSACFHTPAAQAFSRTPASHLSALRGHACHLPHTYTSRRIKQAHLQLRGPQHRAPAR